MRTLSRRLPSVQEALYIDDAALGCPLLVDVVMENHEELKKKSRPYVDWEKVREYLTDHGILPE